MKERRKFVRLGANVNIKWSKAGETGAGKFESSDMSLDVSGGGVCLIVYEQLPIGAKINLAIELPTGKTITSEAQVTWVEEFEIIGGRNQKGYEIGAQFLNLAKKDSEAINQFMIEHPKQ